LSPANCPCSGCTVDNCMTYEPKDCGCFVC
jgi:hypothetical protein